MSREQALLADARAFVRSNWLVLAATAVAMVLAYGLALTSFSLSIDEEMYLVSGPPQHWTLQGRPTVQLVQVLFNLGLPLPFIGTALALVFLWLAAAMWGFLFLRAAGQLHGHRAALLVALIVITTIPVNAHYLMWNSHNVAVSVGLVLAAGSAWFAWLWAVEGWSPSTAVVSILLAVLAMGAYQSLVSVSLAGVLIAQLATLIVPGDAVGRRVRSDISTSLKLVAPIVVAALVGAAMSSLLTRDAYIESLMRWGTEDAMTIVRDLLGQVGSYVTGQGFLGGWVILPVLAVAIGLLVLLVVRAVRGGSRWAPIVLVAILLTPFASSVALGDVLPTRAMLAVPLVAGGLWLLLSFAKPKANALVGGLLVAALLLTVWHSTVNHRLFTTELLTFEIDRAITDRVVERLARTGWDGSVVPLVTVGDRAMTVIETYGASEAFGESAFNLNAGERGSTFFRAVGHPFELATIEQFHQAFDRAATMPSWPADGSVVFEDGLAIVKFADP